MSDLTFVADTILMSTTEQETIAPIQCVERESHALGMKIDKNKK